MKTQKRDSSGRFTSAQAEARKQLVDKAQFPVFHDAVKAMDGETITQTLGKKQAEVERNTKHAQTERPITFITPDGLDVCGIEYTLIDSDGANIFRMAIEDEGAGAFIALKTDDSEIRLTHEELTELARNGETLCKQMDAQHIEPAKKEVRK